MPYQGRKGHGGTYPLVQEELKIILRDFDHFFSSEFIKTEFIKVFEKGLVRVYTALSKASLSNEGGDINRALGPYDWRRRRRAAAEMVSGSSDQHCRKLADVGEMQMTPSPRPLSDHRIRNGVQKQQSLRWYTFGQRVD